MGNFKVGSKVVFIDVIHHNTDPQFYPKVGTIGTVVKDEDERFIRVQWEKGSTSEHDLWWTNRDYVMKEGKKKMENEEVKTDYGEEKAEEPIKEVRCEECGCVVKSDTIHGDVCEECGYKCEECGEWHKELYEVVSFNAWRKQYKEVCETCLDENYTKCYECNDIFHNDDIQHSSCDDRYYCSDCFGEKFSSCDNCGSLCLSDDMHYSDRNENYLCDDCYKRTSFIRDYHDNPEIEFFKRNNNADFLSQFPYDSKEHNFHKHFHMGAEVELCDEDSDDANIIARSLSSIMGEDRMFFCYDGSVSGFECITQPHHYETMLELPWESFFEEARDSSMSNSGCGLHIHVSKDALGRDYDEREDTTLKILYFFEKYWDMIVELSRRSEEDIDSWCSRYDYNHATESINELATKKEMEKSNRYHSVNLSNFHTVEFRIFKGTTKYSEFKLAIDFIYWLCYNCTVNVNTSEIADLNVFDFLKGCDSYLTEVISTLSTRETVEERFKRELEENGIENFVFMRDRSNKPFIMFEDIFEKKMGTFDFYTLFGYDLLQQILRKSYNIEKFPEMIDFSGEKLESMKFSERATQAQSQIFPSFDGINYSTWNYTYNDSLVIKPIRVFFECGYMKVEVERVSDGAKFVYYLKKFKETYLLAEIFGRM